MRKTDNKNIYWNERRKLYFVRIKKKGKIYGKYFKLFNSALDYRNALVEVLEDGREEG